MPELNPQFVVNNAEAMKTKLADALRCTSDQLEASKKAAAAKAKAEAAAKAKAAAAAAASQAAQATRASLDAARQALEQAERDNAGAERKTQQLAVEATATAATKKLTATKSELRQRAARVQALLGHGRPGGGNGAVPCLKWQREQHVLRACSAPVSIGAQGASVCLRPALSAQSRPALGWRARGAMPATFSSSTSGRRR